MLQCFPVLLLSLPLLIVFILVILDMDCRKLKEGDVLKYKTGFLSNKWKKHHLVLFSDSRLCWYEDKVPFQLTKKVYFFRVTESQRAVFC